MKGGTIADRLRTLDNFCDEYHLNGTDAFLYSSMTHNIYWPGENGSTLPFGVTVRHTPAGSW